MLHETRVIESGHKFQVRTSFTDIELLGMCDKYRLEQRVVDRIAEAIAAPVIKAIVPAIRDAMAGLGKEKPNEANALGAERPKPTTLA